jgi:hypothetical protein
MALALNVFRTYTAAVTTSLSTIYTTPAGYTGIVLLAQVTNITSTAGTVTVIITRSGSDTELVKDYDVPGKDAFSPLTGRLVIEPGESLKISANANNTFKIVLSVLETANG